MRWPEHLAAHTTHARKGAVAHVFRYGVDYVLIDPDSGKGPFLFSRNGWNLTSVHDRHHGGPPKDGQGAVWARRVFTDRGLGPDAHVRVLLLTQPRFLGYVFNPVSFWLAVRGDDLIAVIAEVNNTFGDRHSYFCARPDFAPIRPSDGIAAQKVFYVSPFQDMAGTYRFAFDLRADRIAIRIAYRNGDETLLATLSGARAPLTNRAILAASLRRPAGAFRTIVLIHWQALKLKLKRVAFRRRPLPPTHEVT